MLYNFKSQRWAQRLQLRAINVSSYCFIGMEIKNLQLRSFSKYTTSTAFCSAHCKLNQKQWAQSSTWKNWLFHILNIILSTYFQLSLASHISFFLFSFAYFSWFQFTVNVDVISFNDVYRSQFASLCSSLTWLCSENMIFWLTRKIKPKQICNYSEMQQ